MNTKQSCGDNLPSGAMGWEFKTRGVDEKYWILTIPMENYCIRENVICIHTFNGM